MQKSCINGAYTINLTMGRVCVDVLLLFNAYVWMTGGLGIFLAQTYNFDIKIIVRFRFNMVHTSDAILNNLMHQ